MREWPSQFVDLIYLDPPFNSKANYNQTFGTGNGVPAQVRAFVDTWIWNDAAQERLTRLKKAVSHPAHQVIRGLEIVLGESGMLAYLTYMAERLAEMRRLLRDTGSIYLHCDPSASHYLKLLMDGIFGARNFMNEAVWSYRTGGVSKRRWPRKHDILLFYQASKRYKHKPIVERVYYDKPFFTELQDEKGRYYADVYVRDVWEDIKPLINVSAERIGYPTQKPVALGDRIIEASSSKGDLVLDPFVGGGTTVEAAFNKGRNWLGIDISPRAIDLIKFRRLKDASIPVHGIPTDMEAARMMLRSNPFDFEAWAVTRVDGLAPNQVKVGDGGIDGRGAIHATVEGESGLVLAQVKGGNYSAGALRDFQHVMAREDATAGVFITMTKTTVPKALADAARFGAYSIGASSYPRLQFWSIEEYMTEPRVMPKLPPMADPDTGKAVQTDLFRDVDH